MVMYRATPNGQFEMTAQEEADFIAMRDAAIVPDVVSMRQAVLALREAGHLAGIETWVSTTGGDLQIYWDRSAKVRRDHSFVESARIQLALTQADMDQLFILAATKEE